MKRYNQKKCSITCSVSHPVSLTVSGSISIFFFFFFFFSVIQLCSQVFSFVNAYQFSPRVKRSSTSRWSWLPLQILFMTVCIHTMHSVRQLYTPHTQLEAHTAGTAKHSQSIWEKGLCVCVFVYMCVTVCVSPFLNYHTYKYTHFTNVEISYVIEMDAKRAYMETWTHSQFIPNS